MSVPFATRVAVRSEAASESLGPLGVPEVLYRALSAPRPRRILVSPSGDEGVYLVLVIDRAVLALTEKAEEDLALTLLRDGVISVDGLMRARRRAVGKKATLVEGLLEEKVVSPQMLRECAHATTRDVMEELFAVKEAEFQVEDGDRSGEQIFLNVQPDSFIVDFVRRAVTPLRARKVLAEVGDRFRLASEAGSRIGLCGFLAAERDVLQKFAGGDALESHLENRDSSYSQVAAQAIFAGLAIGLLEPDEGEAPIDLWDDIEVGEEIEDTDELAASPEDEEPDEEPTIDERPDEDRPSRPSGFSVPGFAGFSRGAEKRGGPKAASSDAAPESTSVAGAMPDSDFDELLAALKDEPFDSGRLSLLNRLVPRRKFSTGQLIEVFRKMDFDAPGRLEAAQIIYAQLVDPEHFERVYAHLTHADNEDILRKTIGAKTVEESEPAQRASNKSVPDEKAADGGNGMWQGDSDPDPDKTDEVELPPVLPGATQVPAMRMATTPTPPAPEPEPVPLEDVINDALPAVIQDDSDSPLGELQTRVSKATRPVVRPSSTVAVGVGLGAQAMTPGPAGLGQRVEDDRPTPPSRPGPPLPVASARMPGFFTPANGITLIVGMAITLIAVWVGYNIKPGPGPVALTPPPSPSPSASATQIAKASPTRTIVVETPRPSPKPVDPKVLVRRQAAGHWSRGRALHQAGRVSEAIGQFEKAIHLAPNKARYHADLALALYDLDDLKGAENTARKAVSLNRREPWGHLALANVQQASGREADAIRSYETFLALQPSGTMAKDVRQIVRMLKGQ